MHLPLCSPLRRSSFGFAYHAYRCKLLSMYGTHAVHVRNEPRKFLANEKAVLITPLEIGTYVDTVRIHPFTARSYLERARHLLS